ncbi:UDP-2,3-diacylglucosamine diphosphatase [Solemya velesiana gill symbiont]|uniref:UDP-2,3-diacylglucosamine hydrolase n=1 Tax=Solemya velesiana gill symbiont TaxID=1918948 RepID=A0A1T2KSI0_9GAMM|nr:UDP-2,3-diacylglucosamine diphosphatase [Solemya velesiana gill symbiont]OOZ35828.1 UDP-2,3-diacylglucosamine diphosphatase [Solemya velesiana gill symbiont]
MTDTLLISDLHLSGERPDTVNLFLRFLEEQAIGSTGLYILGDLFDAWIGDDDRTPPIPKILDALKWVTGSGTETYLMHGNRDFLISQAFTEATGCALLNDPTVVTLAGAPTLLMHGDLLCTDDLEYQQARKFLRSPAFIDDMMSKSLEERAAVAAEYRKRSKEVVSRNAAEIMDVNQQTVAEYMREHGVTTLIHGHTHRPGIHDFQLDGKPARRYVLDQWHHDQGSYLKATDQAISAQIFAG